MDSANKRRAKPLYSLGGLQKRQKRLPSLDGSAELLPKLKANLSKNDILKRLRDLVGTNCPTNADKFHLLRRRDALMSKLRALEADAGDQQITQGTCPDMCPEKERYMREVKKAVHSFECNAQGEMLHERMVKDYSRSAADQDAPLPHELRPLATLQMNMDYLIFKIASQMPNSNTELTRWYDFLWSRTRAIRKDITQQMLQTELAVDLVEKCARLHIFASFRLALLEAELFDHKMNTENLSKSLQTLRHMYDDLTKKQTFCPNEPEFRSYDIILNLSDFNVHSQVLSYRPAVRDSPQVQLALSLASALQNNNYVRFFRLVRYHATFLQACLCHHFFSLVRSTALKVICMAYNIYPLDAFVANLAFDSPEQAVNFLHQFHLELDDTDPNLVNVRDGRNMFAQGSEVPGPEAIPQTSCLWIESKARNVSLPQILCNDPTAGYPAHLRTVAKPVDSFSPEGAYTNDPVLDELLSACGQTVVAARQQMEQQKQPSSMAASAFSFTKPLPSAFQPHHLQAGFAPRQGRSQPGFADLQRDALIERVVTSELAAVAERVTRIVVQMRLEQIRANLRIEWLRGIVRRWISYARTKRMANSLLDSAISQYLLRISSREFSVSKRDFLQQLALEIATSQQKVIIEKVVGEQLYSIACRTRAKQVRDLQQRLDRIRENLHRTWLRQFSDHWLAVVRRNRVLRSITLLNQGSCSFNAPKSPSRRLFKPGAKIFTPEQMSEMAEQRMLRIEDEDRKRDQASLQNGTDLEHRVAVSPAVALFEELRSITILGHDNLSTSVPKSPTRRLFKPGVKSMTPEQMQQMAEQRLRDTANAVNGNGSAVEGRRRSWHPHYGQRNAPQNEGDEELEAFRDGDDRQTWTSSSVAKRGRFLW